MHEFSCFCTNLHDTLGDMPKPMLILIAGPYRSGTNDEPARLAANLASLESVSWPIFQAGHVPMIGEWVALPVMRAAGIATERGLPVYYRIEDIPGVTN